jgi:hypothetical protein
MIAYISTYRAKGAALAAIISYLILTAAGLRLTRIVPTQFWLSVIETVRR